MRREDSASTRVQERRRSSRKKRRGENHPDAPAHVFRVWSRTQKPTDLRNVKYSNSTLMEFLQDAKGKSNHDCKLVAFSTRKVTTCGCVMVGRTPLMRKSYGKCLFLTNNAASGRSLQGDSHCMHNRSNTCLRHPAHSKNGAEEAGRMTASRAITTR